MAKKCTTCKIRKANKKFYRGYARYGVYMESNICKECENLKKFNK